MTAKSDNKIAFKEKVMTYFSNKWRVLIYTLCGIGLCWIDLWRGIGNGAQWAFAVNCTGFCILPFIALRLDWRPLIPGGNPVSKWKKLFRICFYVWIIIFGLLAYPAFKHFAPGTDYDLQVSAAVANVGIYGAASIRLYFYLFHEKKENTANGKADSKITWIFTLWLAFMVFAVASVNESLWPLWFMVMFGSFYLAPLQKRDAEEIVEGLVNGMIIGFFWIQGRAFLYRPYDLDPRYRGHYTNPNVNAMFYMTTYIAWLTKLTIYRIRKNTKRYACAFFMASSMWAFVFFTNCRSATMGFAGITLAYWFLESRHVGKNRIISFVSRGLLMVVCAAFAFMPVYMCIRYIPPLRHHPIWYGGEYGENSILSSDPIDSSKYMNLKEILETGFGRSDDSSEQASEAQSVSYMAVASLPDSEGSYAQDLLSEDGEEVYWYADGIKPGSDPEHPIYIKEDYSGSLLRRLLTARYYIYRYVIKNIHLMGNHYSEDVVWIDSEFALYHMHSTILQMAYWFGAIAGLLFLILMLVAPVKGLLDINTGSYYPAQFTILAIIGVFLAGLFECIAFPGEMGLTLFFISLLPVVRKN